MSTVSTVPTASDIQMDYMKLLTTQLRNQDPLEPLDNNDMASQLAQFSQLQQLETMNSSFAKILTAVEHSYANSLIGKEVSFLEQTETGLMQLQSGKVEQIISDTDGQIFLVTEDYTVNLQDIIAVKN